MTTPDEVFSADAARIEDTRALAAELEERRQFFAEFEAWLDGVLDEPPSYPTPETLHHDHAIPTRS